MARYNIYAGVRGTKNLRVMDYCYTDEFETRHDALKDAHDQAIREYEAYQGLPGIPDWDEVADDYLRKYGISGRDLTDEELQEIDELYYREILDAVIYDVILESEDPNYDALSKE